MRYDYRRPRAASAADLHGLVQKYMSMLGLDIAPVVKLKNTLGARNLGTCAWNPRQTTSTISIEKRVLSHPPTLERIVAHEMAHHAVFVDAIKAIRRIETEKGARADPYVRGYLRGLSREGHGDDWLRYVAVINSHMGSDFVTRTSDHTYVEDAKTKPYFVLISKLPNGKFGFQIGVTLSAKMKQAVERAQREYGAKLIRTTDPRWQYGPRIGNTTWVAPNDKQDEMQRLHSSTGGE